MPRRIRLYFQPNVDRRACDLTDIIDDVIVCTYRTRPHGASYAAWKHQLSPHYRQKTTTEWLPSDGQPGRVGYRHWAELVDALR